MENITLEKVIKFDSVIDSIESCNVNNELRYSLLEDNTHATGTIKISGSVNTLIGPKSFDEDVEVDIYAPFKKRLDENEFKLNIKDFSYMVNQQNLIVYIVLSIEGIVDANVNEENDDNDEDKEKEKEVDYNNIVNSMNNINDINTNEVSTRNKLLDENKENVSNDNNLSTNDTKAVENKTKLKIKENDNLDDVGSSWATDLFKLTDSYTVFDKIHLD